MMQTANADFNPDEINTGILDCNEFDAGDNFADCDNDVTHTVTPLHRLHLTPQIYMIYC